MAPPSSLKDVYIEELSDLVSANVQMQKIMPEMAQQASDQRLKDLLQKSVTGIGQHTETIRQLLQAQGGGREDCKGMEGLVEEVRRHALNIQTRPDLRDTQIIAAYQRMSHYGVAGFGTAAAYANALGLQEDTAKLKQIVSDIYQADEYTTELALRAERAAAQSS
jgi:ferritin-like metal-binding protein YciE